MGARTKLNVAYVNGGILIAALFGLAFESWGVFLIALGLALAGGLCGGDIRPTPRRR